MRTEVRIMQISFVLLEGKKPETACWKIVPYDENKKVNFVLKKCQMQGF